MRIYVLGQSGSGKTPFSKMVGEKLNLPVISAGNWINGRISLDKQISKQKAIDLTTETSIKELRNDPDVCIDYVVQLLNMVGSDAIIEGIKNPRDFATLFDISKDLVIFLNRDKNPYTASSFEMGIVVIDHYVNWAASTGLLDQEKRVNFKYEISELPSVVENFVKFFNYMDWCLKCGGRGCEHQR